MIFASLLFLTGITLSAVAIYYSVIGLTSIFAAAFWPVVVMGTTLEISKLVAASWLKAYWEDIPRFMKIYMSAAVVVLMIITSMGIFGFLSKAHSDQSLVSGDVQSKIAVYDEKIKTAKDNIEANRKALRQMDEAVDQVMGRSSDEKGAEKAVQIRRSQQKERGRLQSEIAAEQKIIAQVNEERAPIAAEVRKVEAEVGPIKYIAALIYGDNPDANLLEKAVTWVILIIVFVFDPLAVLLLLGSQMTYQWSRNTQIKSKEDEEVDDWFDKVKERARFWDKKEESEPVVDDSNTIKFWPFPVRNPDPDAAVRAAENIDSSSKLKLSDIVTKEKNFTFKQSSPSIEESASIINDDTALEQWNKMIEEAERAVKDEQDLEDSHYIDSADQLEKEAMKRWKEANPEDSLKRQRKMFDYGSITELPWMVEPYYINDELKSEEVAQSYNEVAATRDVDQRVKPDLTEVIEPTQGLKLSDLKKKDLTYLEKIGQAQIQKTLK